MADNSSFIGNIMAGLQYLQSQPNPANDAVQGIGNTLQPQQPKVSSGIVDSIVNSLKGQPFSNVDQPSMGGGLEDLIPNSKADVVAGAAGIAIPGLGKIAPEMLDSVINARNSLYHVTSTEALHSILDSGVINKSTYSYPTTLADLKTPVAKEGGVSMARVPQIDTKHGPVTIVLDPKKVPANAPLAEIQYGKVGETWSGRKIQNPAFEYENRTKGTDIPISAARGILINGSRVLSRIQDDLIKKAAAKGIPVKVLPNSRTILQYRNSLLKLPENLRWSILMGSGLGAGALSSINTSGDEDQ